MEEPKDLGDPMAVFRPRMRKCEARDVFNSVDVLQRAFEGDWSAIQRGKGDAGLLSMLGLKGDPTGQEMLNRGVYT